MKPFVLVMGNADYNTGEGVKPTLIGIVDPINAKNFVTVSDILKGDEKSIAPSNRIAEVLYNLGIRLNVNAHIIDANGVKIEGFSVTYDFRDEVNPDMFDRVEVFNTDIWDYYDANGVIPMSVKKEIADALKASGVSFTDDEFTTITTAFAQDAYSVLLNQYYAMDGYGAEKKDYSIYCANMPVNISNINNLAPRGNSSAKNMHYPNSDIPFQVPSFYELMCHRRHLQNNEKLALNNIGHLDDEDVSMENEYQEESETHLFSKDDFTFEEIYRPKYMFNARTVDTSRDGSFEVPIINPNVINVRSVTQFWEVTPARKIPADAYGRKADNTMYILEDLIGHHENNHLTIQDNERRYYAQLDRLLTIAVSIEHNALSDEVYATVKDKVSTVVEDYCKTLAEEAFNLMWCHTGTTQSVYPELYDDDESDSDSEGSSDITSKVRMPCKYGNVEKGNDGLYKFIPTIAGFSQTATSEAIAASIRKSLPRLSLGFDGDVETGFVHHTGALVGYINGSSNNHRWIDALIRLLRWGDRKPSMLTTEDIRHGDDRPDKYWDLNSASVSSNDGCIDNLQPEVNPDTGNEYNLVAVITANVFAPVNLINLIYPGLSDKLSFVGAGDIHIPIGVAFEVKMQGSNTYKTYYEDIFTYADKLKKGISRGSVVYENGMFKCFNGDSSAFVGEIDLVEVNKYLEQGAINQMIEDTDEAGNQIMRDIFIKFMTTSNSQIVSTRNAFASKCNDSKKYTVLSDKKNLFTAIAEYMGVGTKSTFLSAGKQMISTGKLPNILVANPENTRIAYMFLDKLLKLAYSPTMYEQQPTCDIVDVLNKLEAVIELEATRNEAIAPANAKPTVFDEFVKFVTDAGISTFAFKCFKKSDGLFPFVLGISRDKAKPVIIFTSTEDLERLKQSLGSDADKLYVFNKPLDDESSKVFRNAIKIYNKNGKKIDKAQFNITNGTVLFSSEKAMETIYQNFNK